VGCYKKWSTDKDKIDDTLVHRDIENKRTKWFKNTLATNMHYLWRQNEFNQWSYILKEISLPKYVEAGIKRGSTSFFISILPIRCKQKCRPLALYHWALFLFLFGEAYMYWWLLAKKTLLDRKHLLLWCNCVIVRMTKGCWIYPTIDYKNVHVRHA